MCDQPISAKQWPLFLQHDSHNKVSIAENIPPPCLGIDPWSPRYKTIALTTEPKSPITDAVVRD